MEANWMIRSIAAPRTSFPVTPQQISQRMMKPLAFACFSLAAATSAMAADSVFVEAESFQNPGGWSLDTQFVETMGSPYLIAHGYGKPVKDATTTTTASLDAGKYRVWVRAKNWVGPWDATGSP